jgi:hypothetical protein
VLEIGRGVHALGSDRVCRKIDKGRCHRRSTNADLGLPRLSTRPLRGFSALLPTQPIYPSWTDPSTS